MNKLKHKIIHLIDKSKALKETICGQMQTKKRKGDSTPFHLERMRECNHS